MEVCQWIKCFGYEGGLWDLAEWVKGDDPVRLRWCRRGGGSLIDLGTELTAEWQEGENELVEPSDSRNCALMFSDMPFTHGQNSRRFYRVCAPPRWRLDWRGGLTLTLCVWTDKRACPDSALTYNTAPHLVSLLDWTRSNSQVTASVSSLCPWSPLQTHSQ